MFASRSFLKQYNRAGYALGALLVFMGPQASAATAIYRSIGVAASAIATGTGNGLTISGSTASFTSDLPNNVGVGDGIQYDSDNNGSIDKVMFIHGRTDARTFTVKKADGSTNPDPISSGPADENWSVIRAYSSIFGAARGQENLLFDDTIEDFDVFGTTPRISLTAQDKVWNLAAYADGTDLIQDGSAVYWDQWVTDATRYVRLFTPVSSSEVGVSQRHAGKWAAPTSAYTIQSGDSGTFTGQYVVKILFGHVRIEGIQFYRPYTNATDQYLLWIDEPGGGQIYYTDNIMRGNPSNTQNYHMGLLIYHNSSGHAGGASTYYVRNNIFYDWTGSVSSCAMNIASDTNTAGDTVYAYNNTMHNVRIGFWHEADTSQQYVLKNNLVQGAVNAYNNAVGSWGAGSSNNISNVTGEDTDDPAIGVTVSTSVSFLDSTNADHALRDFHLANGDTVAKDAGTSLSGDTNMPFSTDIDGVTRSGTWDIGADEAASNNITVSSLTTSNVTSTGFDVRISFVGDGNANATCALNYCNASDSPTCTPTGALAMTRGSGQFIYSVTGLSNPNDPGDSLALSISCSDTDGVTGSPLTGSVTLSGVNGITVSNLTTLNVTNTAFDVRISYTGDSDSEASCSLSYCNGTDSPSCTPAGSLAMTRGAGVFTRSVTGLTDPGDGYKLSVSCSDSTSVTGSPLTGSVTLTGLNSVTVSSLATSNVTSTAFDAQITVAGDSDNDSSCALNYCNATDDPSCTPAGSLAMTRGGGVYTRSVSSLTTPNDPGDTLKLSVSCSDADGVTGSPLTANLTLAGVNGITVASNLTTSSVTSTGFTATIGFSGDSNSNSSCALDYCNASDNPSCAVGGNVAMTRGAGVFSTSVAGLSTPNDPGDTLKIRVSCSDADGASGSPQSSFVTLGGVNAITVSSLSSSNITSTGFDVQIGFTGDSDNDSSCALNYCNATDNPSCTPAGSLALTKGAGVFTRSVTGLSTPNDPGDTLKLSISCSDADGVTGSPLTGNLTLSGLNSVTVSNLATSSITNTGFTASVGFAGDSNSNTSCALDYCNATDNPSCAVGGNVAMTRGAGVFSTSVAGLSSPNDPGDTLKISVTCSDADGITGSPLTGMLTLDGVNGITISNLTTGSVTSTSFSAQIQFSGDSNTNSACTLYRCNNTDHASCDPTNTGAFGTATAMTRGAGVFTASVSSLSSPDDGGDQLNLAVTCSDANGVTGSPLTSTVTLAVVNTSTLTNLTTVNATHTSFTAQVDLFGDQNNDSSCTFKWCNQTDNAGCVTANNVAMTKSGGKYTVDISGLGTPNDVGDVLKIELACSDGDGITGGTLTSTMTIPDTLAPSAPTGLTVE